MYYHQIIGHIIKTIRLLKLIQICKQPLYTAKNRKERSIATSTIESIISNEEQKEECCVTNHFNKAYYQDFEPGLETEYVELSIIGGCANFEFETNMIFEGFLKAKHEGKYRF